MKTNNMDISKYIIESLSESKVKTISTKDALNYLKIFKEGKDFKIIDNVIYAFDEDSAINIDSKIKPDVLYSPVLIDGEKLHKLTFLL